MPKVAATIGRVAVKVLPDTGNFGREAKTKLDAIEKRLEMKVELVPELNTSIVSSRARQLKTRVERTLDGVTMDVDIDDSRAVRAINALKAKTDAVGDIDVDVSVSSTTLDATLLTLNRKISRILGSADAKISPAVDIDDGKVAAAIARLKAVVGQTANIDMPVQLDLDNLGLNRALADLKVKLAPFQSQVIEMPVDIKAGRLAATLATLKGRIEEITKLDFKGQLDRESTMRSLAEFDRLTRSAGEITLRIDRDSEASMRSALGEIRGRMAQLLEIPVTLETDYDSLARAAEELDSRLKKVAETKRRTLLDIDLDRNSVESVQAAIAALDAQISKRREIKFSVQNDRASISRAKAELEGLLRQAQPVAPFKVAINPRSVASMEAALKSIEAELERRRAIEFTVEPNRASLTAAAEKIRADIARATYVQLDIDNRRAAEQIAVVQRRLGEITFKPKVDQRDIDRALFDIEGKFHEIEKLKLKLRMEPEMDAVARREVERQIHSLERDVDDIKAKVKPQISSLHLKAIKTALAVAARTRVVTFLVRVSKASLAVAGAQIGTALAALSGARVLNSIFSNLFSIIRNFDRLAPIIGIVTTAIFGLVAALGAGISNAVSLIYSLGTIGPLALALPGLFAGLGIGAGVLVAALKDFNDVFPDVKAALAAMQDSISEKFWDQAKAPMRDMIDTLLPQFSAGFDKTATSLGGFFGKLSTSIKNTIGDDIPGMFKNLTDSIDIAALGTDAYAGIIEKLGKVGAAQLPRLAAAVVTVSAKFDSFLSQAEADGRLNNWINTAIEAAKDLGRVLMGVFDIFAGLGRAAQAAGGSTLSTLADTLQRIGDVINQPGFQSALSDFFGGAHEAIQAIQDIAGNTLVKTLETLGHTLADIMPLVGTTIGYAVDAIATVLGDKSVQMALRDFALAFKGTVQQIAIVFSSLGPTLGNIIQLLGTAMQAIGPLLSAALLAVVPVFNILVRAIQPVITVLAGGLTKAVTALAPFLLALAEAFELALGPVLEAAPLLLQGLTTGLAGVLTGVAAAIGPIGQLIGTLGTVLGPVLASVGIALGTVISNLVSGLAPAIEMILPVLGEIVVSFATMFAELAPKLVPVFLTLGETIATVGTQFLLLLQPVLALIPVLVSELLPVFQNLMLAWVQIAKSLLPALGNALRALTPFLAPMIALFAQLQLMLAETIIPLMAQFGAAILTQITASLQRLLPSLIPMVEQLTDVAIQIMPQLIPLMTQFGNLLGGPMVGQVMGIVSAILSLVQGLQELSGLIGKVQSAANIGLGGLTGIFNRVAEPQKRLAATAALDLSASPTIQTASVLATSGGSGLVGSLTAATAAIGKTLGKLGANVRSSLDLDETIEKFKNVGALAVDGLITGLSSKQEALRSALAQLSSTVDGTTIGPPQMADIAAPGNARAAAARMAALSSGGAASSKTLNYYAAPGSSLGAEEDLFAAANRGRFVWGD